MMPSFAPDGRNAAPKWPHNYCSNVHCRLPLVALISHYLPSFVQRNKPPQHAKNCSFSTTVISSISDIIYLPILIADHTDTVMDILVPFSTVKNPVLVPTNRV